MEQKLKLDSTTLYILLAGLVKTTKTVEEKISENVEQLPGLKPVQQELQEAYSHLDNALELLDLSIAFSGRQEVEQKEELKKEIDATGNNLASEIATVLDENIAKIESVILSRMERLNAALNSIER